jgi:hypothetical protein
MTVDPYIGSAGGQPRLFIPTMGQFQDPSVETAMNVILRWANSLLLNSSTGGVVAYAGFTALVGDNTHPNPVTWTGTISDGVFHYMDSGVQNIVAFPSHSYSIIQYGWSTNGGGVSPSSDASRIFLLLVGAGSALVSNAVDPDFAYNVGITPTDLEDGRSGFLHVDSDNVGATALPWHFDGLVTDVPAGMGMYLNIVSWSKP